MARPNKTADNSKWWLKPLLVLLALGIAYLTFSRALDNGSWWEYLYSLILLIFVINRLQATFRGKRKSS